MKTNLFVLILMLFSNQLYSQWPAYPNYNIPIGSYSNCSTNSMNFTVPGYITSTQDNNSTVINFDLLPSNIKSQQYIQLNPGIKVEANCNAESHTLFSISQGICEVSFLNLVNGTPGLNGTVGLNDKVEIGVQPSTTIINAINNFFTPNPTGQVLNPYNPDHSTTDYVDIVCHFTTPTRSFNRYGFFMRDYVEDSINNTFVEVPTEYPMRIRIAPDELGLWKVEIDVHTAIGDEPFYFSSCANGYDNTLNNSLNFFVVPDASNKGYLEVGWHKNYLIFNNPNTPNFKESFFGISYNVAAAYDIVTWHERARVRSFEDQRNFFREAADNGANLIRVAIGPETFGVEWEHLGVYDAYQYTHHYIYNNIPMSSTYKRNRQENAWEMDRMLDLAELKNVYLDAEMGGSNTTDNVNYPISDHPYGTLVSNFADVYTDPVVRKFVNQRLRYLISRWGYSTHIAVWEIANEIDKCYDYGNHSVDVNHHIINSAIYLKDDLHVKQLKSFSFATSPSGYTAMNNSYIDINDIHEYGNDKNVNYYKRADVPNTYQFNKPIMMGEMGMDWNPAKTINPRFYESCNGVSFHNAIWSTAFMGFLGCGANWGWFNACQVGGNHYVRDFVELATFMKGIDFEDNYFRPHRYNDQTYCFCWDFDCSWNPTHLNYTLETYNLINFSKTRAIGWFHNATCWWGNLGFAYPCVSNLDLPCDDDIYPVPLSGGQMPDLAITGLKRGSNVVGPLMKKYYYDFYKTHGGTLYDLNSIYWRSGHTHTNWFGIAYIGVNNLDLNIANENDFAFKMYTANNNFRVEEDTTGLYALQFDTLCTTDTIPIESIYENDSLCAYSYFWYFGNGVTSNLCQPTFTNSIPGNYTIYYIVTDSAGNRIDSVGLFLTMVDCNSNNQNREKSTHMEQSTYFKIYPNPAHGMFIISNPNLLIYDFYVFDITGKSLMYKTINSIQFENVNLSSFENGLYYIKIISSNGIDVFKIIKQ